MRHCLCIDDISPEDIQSIIDQACALIDPATHRIESSQQAQGREVIMLFYEPSTRTHMSFALAAHRLGASVQMITPSHSSEQKGESFQDTIISLAAMSPDALVVRHPKARVLDSVVGDLPEEVHLINAGDGDHAHPTQGLLDTATIQHHKGAIQNLTVAIVGDSRHSRAAHSQITCLQKLGVQAIHLIAPEVFRYDGTGDRIKGFDDIGQGLQGCDAVIVHRLQQERLSDALKSSEAIDCMHLSAADFEHAKDDAILMHPGPVNWGQEIDEGLKAHPRSMIKAQIQMGVATRMALFSHLFRE